MANRSDHTLRFGRDWLVGFCLRCADLLSLIIAGLAAYWWLFGPSHFVFHERYQWAMLVGGLIQLWLFPLVSVYQSWRGRWLALMIFRLVLAYALWLLIAVVVMFSFHLFDFSRLWLVSWTFLSVSFSLIFRAIAYAVAFRIRSRGKNLRSVLLIGDADSCRSAYKSLKLDRSRSFEVTRVLVVNYEFKEHLHKFSGVVDSYDPNLNVAVSEDEVWVCMPLSKGEEAHRIINSLDTVTANIRLMPTMSDLRLINHSASTIAGLYLINVSCSPMTGISRLKKRILDVTLSCLILVLISPLFFLVMLCIRLGSGSPVFYRQERVSWNGHAFQMMKFRSMAVDNETQGVEWGGAKGKSVTRFGSFIRRTSIDELPQFLNVLKGDMSIVGPRPERTVFVEQFQSEIPGYMQKHLVKAGITGWAQVNGWRGDTSLEKRIENDLWYIENWSIWLDIKIIMLTAIKVLFDKSAC